MELDRDIVLVQTRKVVHVNQQNLLGIIQLNHGFYDQRIDRKGPEQLEDRQQSLLHVLILRSFEFLQDYHEHQ